MTIVKRLWSPSGGPVARPRWGRFSVLAAGLVGLAMVAAPAQAAPTFAQFSEVAGNGFTFNSTTGVLSGTDSGLLNFISFPGQPTTQQPVTITLNATSVPPAQSIPVPPITGENLTNGTLTFTTLTGGPNPAGQNLLTATFIGSISGTTGSQQVNISVTPSSLTSSVINTSLITSLGLLINFNNLIQPGGGNAPSINGATGNLNTFTANVTGAFTGNVVPEPASFALFGIGLVAAGTVTLRRKSLAAAAR